VFFSSEIYRSEGQDYFYPEFGAPATNNGRARGLDRDGAERALAKARLGDFQVEGAVSSRRKRVPTAAYSTIFNDDRFQTRDRQAFAALSYEHPFADLSRVFLTASYNWYRYDGAYPYASALTRDYADADWVTLDGQYLRLFGSGHTVSVGGEARWNSRQAQGVYDVNPPATYLRDRRSSSVYAAFIQTALRLAPRVLLYAGVRHDRYEGFGGTTNPRGSLVIAVDPRTSVKLLYGRAFRAPNNYERFYQDGGATQKPAPGLRPEVVETYEFAASRELGHGVRAEASLYRQRVQRLIGLTTDPADSLLVYRNLEQARSTGVEVEVAARLAGGVQGRISYAYQHASDGTTQNQPVNSPRHLARVGLSMPAWGDRVVGSAEVRYASARPTRAGDRAAAHALTNLTLLARPVSRGPAELSLSIYNLFGNRYGDPGGEEHAQDLIQQDRRTIRAGLRFQF
jgi:iron complex outermembrane receptor protein